jgi:hypothetical protein
MRIRIVQKPGSTSIDGVRLQDFEPGQSYEIGSTLGALLLAEGWAVPDDAPDLGSNDPPTRQIRGIYEPPRALRDIAADYSRPSRKE